jgi:hypothetical protein
MGCLGTVLDREDQPRMDANRKREWTRIKAKQPQMNPPPLRYGATGCGFTQMGEKTKIAATDVVRQPPDTAAPYVDAHERRGRTSAYICVHLRFVWLSFAALRLCVRFILVELVVSLLTGSDFLAGEVRATRKILLERLCC